jgi:hypothetical protein
MINDVSGCPELWTGKIIAREMQADLDLIEKTCERVKKYVDQYVAHHDRNSSAVIPTHGELNEAVDAIVETYRRYHIILKDSDIESVLQYLSDPLAIFTFPWLDSNKPDRDRQGLINQTTQSSSR